MRRSMLKSVRFLLAVSAGALCLFVSDARAPGTIWITQADARIGRPLTPFSYAGVARRTTRRAVAAGALVRPVVVAPPVAVVTPARRCVQAVDVYGRIITRCY